MTPTASRSPRDRSLESQPLPVLGAILAGGASRRFGATKALAAVGGTELVARARDTLLEVVEYPVLITHLPAVAQACGLPSRPDTTAGSGPLAGIEASLRWAAELGLPGALCVACDLPFLPSALLRDIVREGLDTGALSVVPESGAPDGIEPLCAWYSAGTLPVIERALGRGELRVSRVVEELGARRLPLSRVALHGEPSALFLNVNTPAGHAEAERMAARKARAG